MKASLICLLLALSSWGFGLIVLIIGLATETNPHMLFFVPMVVTVGLGMVALFIMVIDELRTKG